MPGEKRKTSDQDNSDNPSWDTTPMTMRKWLLELPEYLADINDDFVTWWESGYVMNKTLVACPTSRHACALRDGAVDENSFSDPIDVNELFEDAALPRGTRGLNDTDLRTYQVAEKYGKKINTQLAKEVVNTITEKQIRRKFLTKCGGNGIALIVLLHEMADKVGVHANTAIAN